MFQLHIAVLLFGFSGLFGKFLSLPPLLIVAGRTFFAALTLVALLLVVRRPFPKCSSKELALFALTGVLLSIHWMAFFYAVQISTVAIALLSFSTFPIFVTFLEPLFFGGRPERADVLAAVTVLLGLSLVGPEFRWENSATLGILVGVFAGLTFALLALLNRLLTKRFPSSSIALAQNFVAFLSLTPWLIFQPIPSAQEFLGLALLGVLCTAAAHTLFIAALQTVRAQVAAVVTCLEPIYGILFAFIFFREIPTLHTVLGGAIVVGTAMAVAYRDSQRKITTNTQGR